MILFLLILLFTVILYLKAIHRPKNYPPGPAWQPFVGNSREVRDLAIKLGGQHLAFEHLARKYNTNVLGLKLGGQLTVIVSSYKLVRQAFMNDKLNGRADNFFMRLRCLGKRRGITCTDGPFWIEQRKFVERHLKSVGYGRMHMENMIQEETNTILHLLSDMKNDPVEFGTFLAPSVLNILWTLATGNNVSRDDSRISDLLKILSIRNSAFTMAGGILNSFPWLRFIFPEKTGYNFIVRLNQQLKLLFNETIEEHKNTWFKDRRDDLIYSFITEMKTNNQSKTFTEHQLLAICLDLFFGGSLTTSTTIDFVFLNLIIHPEIQEKAANCLRTALNIEEPITYSDRFKVPYFEAILSESERFHHIVPLAAPRRALSDITLDGYHITKGTDIFINLHSNSMDEEYWKDPYVFRPERFINDEGKFITNERIITFGLGKRRCLGELLARQCVFIITASILRKYKICQHPGSESLSDIPVPGILLTPRPYNAKLIPRDDINKK